MLAIKVPFRTHSELDHAAAELLRRYSAWKGAPARLPRARDVSLHGGVSRGRRALLGRPIACSHDGRNERVGRHAGRRLDERALADEIDVGALHAVDAEQRALDSSSASGAVHAFDPQDSLRVVP